MNISMKRLTNAMSIVRSTVICLVLFFVVTTLGCYNIVNGSTITSSTTNVRSSLSSSSSSVSSSSSSSLRVNTPSKYHHRSLQQVRPCYDQFAVYNATSNTTNPLGVQVTTAGGIIGRILVDKYPKGRINILYDPTSCYTNVKCVKLTWGTFQETIQTVIPYALYGDENGIPLTVKPFLKSWQLLTATNYRTADCSGGGGTNESIIAIDTLNVQIVPQTEKIYRFRTVRAIYNGTTASNASNDDITAVVNATCDFIKEHINNALLLRASMQTTQFLCLLHPGSTTTNITSTLPIPPPLSITYRIVFNLIQLPKLSQYVNRDLMTNSESTSYIKGLFNDTNKIGIYGDVAMSSWVKNKLSDTNPYKSYTTITIV